MSRPAWSTRPRRLRCGRAGDSSLPGSVEPLARTVEVELVEKLEQPFRLDLGALARTDITSRARAFKALVEAGLQPQEARTVVGI